MQDFPGPIQRASEGVNSKARGARMSPWLCYRGREQNQLENTLAAPPQFEVNYLNANLIALSFIFTYPSYLFLSGNDFDRLSRATPQHLL